MLLADSGGGRRYIVLVQAAEGYPPPPGRDGPPPPALHSAVLEADYLPLVQALRQALTDLHCAETAFRKVEEGTEATPPHVRRDDARRACERIEAVLREHAGEND